MVRGGRHTTAPQHLWRVITVPVAKLSRANGMMLRSSAGDVKWNFAAKFIIDKEGNVVERNGDSPAASEAKIKKLLAA